MSFFRSETEFEKYIAKAKRLSDALCDLTKSMDEAINPNSIEDDINTLLQSQGKKFKKEVLENNPLTLPEEQQEASYQKIKTMEKDLFFETLTLNRDQFLNKICKLHINLHTLASLAQASLIENLELKQNAHNRNVPIKFGRLKEHISAITDDDLIKAFQHLLENYKYLHDSLNSGDMTLLSLMFVPDANTPNDAAEYTYKIRAATYLDNQHYQRFKELIEILSGNKVFESFQKFMDGNPTSRHFSKKLLAELKPMINEIEQLQSASLNKCINLITGIEQARDDDFKQIMTKGR